MKIIFLDVDGVLINHEAFKQAHDEKRRERAHESCVEELNRIVKETGALVVMSSCWRVCRKLMEIKDLLYDWGVKCTVLHKTPYHSSLHNRGAEIQAWLDSYNEYKYIGPIESFVILDDDSDMDHLLPHLVKCNTQDGLTKQNADAAIEHLSAKVLA